MINSNKNLLTRRAFLSKLTLGVLSSILASCNLNPLKSSQNPFENNSVYTLTPDKRTELEPGINNDLKPTQDPLMNPPIITQELINFLVKHEVREGDVSRPVIMLTYDDVGTFDNVEVILRALKRYPVSKATFFFIGEKIISSAKVVRAIIEDGHILGCHGWSHRPFGALSDGDINNEMERCFEAVNKVVSGFKFQFIRFPYGDSLGNPRVLSIAAKWGLQHIYWTMGSNGLTKDTYQTILRNVKNGSIVLSHMFRKYDINQSEIIVRTLIDMGYSLESVQTGRKPSDIFS